MKTAEEGREKLEIVNHKKDIYESIIVKHTIYISIYHLAIPYSPPLGRKEGEQGITRPGIKDSVEKEAGHGGAKKKRIHCLHNQPLNRPMIHYIWAYTLNVDSHILVNKNNSYKLQSPH